jgi:general secretion pathway protein D
MIRPSLRHLALFLLCSLGVLPLLAQPNPGPPALPPPPAADATVGPIRFGDITVDAAIDMLERWSGRTALRPAGLPATSLSFSLNQKVSRDEARRVLESLLTLNGIAVTPLGDKFLKVTPLNLARTEAPELIEGSTLDLPPSGRLAAKLYEFHFLRVSEFAPLITTLLNPGAASPPILFEKANAMLLTDTVSNLQRIETLVAKVDQPALTGIAPKFYKVVNSSASALATKIRTLLAGPAGAQLGSTTAYEADDRTNQIILISDPRQQPFFDELVARLDVAGESGTRQEVLPLKHASATDIATLLTSLIAGQNNASSRTGTTQTATRPAANTSANPPTRPAGQATAGTAVAASPVLALPPGLTEASQQFSSILTVVADERSNSLVVSGTFDDLRLIKDIVAQLDVLLAQVRIEVVIAEVTLSDEASSGIETLGFNIQADKIVGFSGSSAGLNVTQGVISRGTTGGTSLAATLALSTTPRKGNTNILSVPTIVTTHNKEATLFVGEKRPVISSYLNTGTNTGTVGSGYSTTVSQQEIGITLTVKPLIGRDGSVQMEIHQKVDDVLGEVLLDGNSQPVIGSRTTETFISAHSGEIVVLGGLQRKSRNASTSRLAGLPLLGDLLGKRTRTDSRTELVFFLRPYVLTNTPADNTEALRRLEHSPQRPDVEAVLSGRPVEGKP